jgi:hypothetical protein
MLNITQTDKGISITGLSSWRDPGPGKDTWVKPYEPGKDALVKSECETLTKQVSEPINVRIRDICDVDFSPGKPLSPVTIEGEQRLFAAFEVEQMQVSLRSGLISRRTLFGLGALTAASLLLDPRMAFAANRTAWTAGNGVGFTWTSAQANAGTLASTNSVLDSTDITNQTALDLFCDVSHSLTIASSTIAAGASFNYYVAYLNQDGTTYGDNHVTTTPAAAAPTYPPLGPVPCFAAAAQTSVIGNWTNIVLVPGTFRWINQNNIGFNLTAATIKYRTYNTQNNN